MAHTPSSSHANGGGSSAPSTGNGTAGARFRQRKISTKQSLQILKQLLHPDLEIEELQRDTQVVETGVEKHEEEEHHLKAVIDAAQAKLQGAKVEQVYIPTPDASKVWKDAANYYPKDYILPLLYIKFSCTVEDTSGCPYNMDEEDEDFLLAMNTAVHKKSALVAACTELEFEIMMYRLELVIAEKQPFLSTDPDRILAYNELLKLLLALLSDQRPTDLSTVLEQQLQQELGLKDPFVTLLDKPLPKRPRLFKELFLVFGQQVYAHWRARKLARGGRSIFPTLKFEDVLEKDDLDPYVCFRRRELRQARKTRRQDQQSSERLRRLHSELRNARDMVLLIARREVKHQQLLQAELDVFELRHQIKPLKRELGVSGDDDDLVAHKRKRRPQFLEVEEEPPRRGTKRSGSPPAGSRKAAPPSARPGQLLAQTGYQSYGHRNGVLPYVRLPALKVPDLDLLLTVLTVLREKNEAIKRAVHEKLTQRREADEGYVNFTDDPYVPWFQLHERSRVLDPSHTPFLAIVSGLFEVATSNYVDESIRDVLSGSTPELAVRVFDGNGAPVADSGLGEPSNMFMEQGLESHLAREPLFTVRKRLGRLGRTFVDRRGLVLRPDDALEAFRLGEEPGEEPVDVYSLRADEVRRADLRWRFDSDHTPLQLGELLPLSSDPARLNGISDDTQAIRFGLMLLAKLYDQFREVVQQRQQAKLAARQQALEQKQKAAAAAAAAGGSLGEAGASQATKKALTGSNGSNTPVKVQSGFKQSPVVPGESRLSIAPEGKTETA